MKCGNCGKGVSGVYESGSYSCSGCGGAVEVNPSGMGITNRWSGPPTYPPTHKKKTDAMLNALYEGSRERR